MQRLQKVLYSGGGVDQEQELRFLAQRDGVQAGVESRGGNSFDGRGRERGEEVFGEE